MMGTLWFIVSLTFTRLNRDQVLWRESSPYNIAQLFRLSQTLRQGGIAEEALARRVPPGHEITLRVLPDLLTGSEQLCSAWHRILATFTSL
mmetsp:Transcript_36808/g.84789  ORF Transcript_36808/g.84789 Transcript_36808/m.84789 type:complete len:91 (+) Transcript_36808:1545-1817(+)